jgi:hypothetical protein
MAKIFSPPKMPAPAPIIIDKTESPAAQTETRDDSEAIPEISADEQRVQNILTRKRGRLGTIGTSFRGVLNDGNTLSPARKTLLGE